MIETVRAWFRSCPLLRKDTIFGVDKLGADPVGYEIAPLACQPILQKYVDGTTVRQFQFAFASREVYDEQQNMQNTAFYEQLQAWLEEQSDKGNFPVLGERKKARELQILSSGYVYDTGDSTAIYQMELSLIYIQRKQYH
ncbi:MAG: hypothetical protein Q4D37_05620 [Oscillospiraceae bacterium]|nr:hypothetical protein [Oscillospiraceae bacterium]